INAAKAAVLPDKISAIFDEHRQIAIMKIALESIKGTKPFSLKMKNKRKFIGYTVKYQLSNVGFQLLKALNPCAKNSFHIIGLFAESGSVIHV
ncbi:hypothetical protein G9L14_000650, partial [Escherichia coli]|nr:hypothetical protein [Escherichia coli]HCO0021688.1 hypothetical protein [Escherichia coli]